MIEAVLWPHHHHSMFLEGWEFNEQVDAREVMKLTGDVGEPPGVERGTHRWIEWILGRDAAIKAATRAGVEQPVIGVAGTGAPYLQGTELAVSIAHTRGLALAAVAPEPIGIDVERMDRDVSRLASGLRPAEMEIAMSVGVIGCLVAKEAVAKRTRLGLGGSLSRWPLLDAELSGTIPRLRIATPDGQIAVAQLFVWKEFVVGVAFDPHP